MKTKLLVAALALPLAFSACTQDEFENAQNNGTQIPDNAIKGLVLNVQKSAEGDGADTRGIWQNDKINFEQNDKISLYWLGDTGMDAAPTGSDRATTTGKFNSIFRTTDGESFTSEALVFEGGNIAVYPGDVTFYNEGLVTLKVPAEQDETTLKNVPYISNQLYIKKRDHQTEQLPGYYGEGDELDSPVKLAANVVNLTLNLSNIPQGYGFEVQSVELQASAGTFATESDVIAYTTANGDVNYKGEVVTSADGKTKTATIVAQTWSKAKTAAATAISTTNITKVSENQVIAHFVLLPTEQTALADADAKIVVRTNCGTITMTGDAVTEDGSTKKYQLMQTGSENGTSIADAIELFVTSQKSANEDSKFYGENIGKVADRYMAVDVSEAKLNGSLVYTSADIIRYANLYTAMGAKEATVDLVLSVKGEKDAAFAGLTKEAVTLLNSKNVTTSVFTLSKGAHVNGLEIVGGGEIFDVPAIAATASLPLILSNETWSMKDAFAFKSNGLTGITNNGTLTIEGTEGEDAHNTIVEAITNNGTINLGGDGLVVVADAALKNTADAVINIAADQELQFTKANTNGDLLGTINVNALTARLTATTADVNTNATINNYGTVAGSETNGWVNETYTNGDKTYVGTVKMMSSNAIAYVKDNENGVINLNKRTDEVVIDENGNKGKIVYKWTAEDGKSFKQVAEDRFNYVVFDGAETSEITLATGETGILDPKETSVEIQGVCRLYANKVTIADLTVAEGATLQFTSGNVLNVTDLVNNGLITIGGKINYSGSSTGKGRVLTTGDGAITQQP